MTILLWIIDTLLQWYVWLPIVLVLAFLTFRNYKRIDVVKATESVLLILEIPKANDKKELAALQAECGRGDFTGPGTSTNVAHLVEALEDIAQWTERWTAPGHPVATVARKALAAYRKGGEA